MLCPAGASFISCPPGPPTSAAIPTLQVSKTGASSKRGATVAAARIQSRSETTKGSVLYHRMGEAGGRITADQNRSSPEVYHLTTRGLRVGFWHIRFAVVSYPFPIPNCSGSDSVQRQRQGAAAENSDQCSAAAVRIPVGGMATSGSFNGRGSRWAADVKDRQGAGHP